MARARSTVRMDGDEVRALLGAARKLQVASLDADGTPHLTTLFHVVLDEPAGGWRLAFWTYARSQKVRNLERDPRVTCLVEDGLDYLELRGVSVVGRAEIVRDADRVREVGGLVAGRMTDGADLGDAGRAELDRQAAKRVAVLVTPERVASWDHRKLLG